MCIFVSMLVGFHLPNQISKEAMPQRSSISEPLPQGAGQEEAGSGPSCSPQGTVGKRNMG